MKYLPRLPETRRGNASAASRRTPAAPRRSPR